jgi:CS domain
MTADDMSRLSDYSKFDHIDEDSSNDEDISDANTSDRDSNAAPLSSAVQLESDDNQQHGAATSSLRPRFVALNAKQSSSIRFAFQYPTPLLDGNFRTIYTWEQSLESVELRLPLPSPPANGQSLASFFSVNIQPKHLQVGFIASDKSAPPSCYIDEDLFDTVDTTESSWFIDTAETNEFDESPDKIMVIHLQKMRKGLVWECALMGREGATIKLDPIQLEQIRSTLLKERLAEEYGSEFDFSGAEFNGSVPDPRSYMGGIHYE